MWVVQVVVAGNYSQAMSQEGVATKTGNMEECMNDEYKSCDGWLGSQRNPYWRCPECGEEVVIVDYLEGHIECQGCGRSGELFVKWGKNDSN